MSTDSATSGGGPDTQDRLTPGAVVFECHQLQPGDAVELHRLDYEYANPLDVTDLEVCEWHSADGDVQFASARVELTSGRKNATPHIIEAVSGDRLRWQQGDSTDRVTHFARVDGGETDDEADKAEDGTDVRDAQLPDGVTVDAVETAVATNEYLREVGDDLGLSESAVRAAVFKLELYSDVKEGGRYT